MRLSLIALQEASNPCAAGPPIILKQKTSIVPLFPPDSSTPRYQSSHSTINFALLAPTSLHHSRAILSRRLPDSRFGQSLLSYENNMTGQLKLGWESRCPNRGSNNQQNCKILVSATAFYEVKIMSHLLFIAFLPPQA